MFIFSEPHDGVSGAAKALPKDVKRVIDGMNGERMSLAAAFCRIGEAKPGGTKLITHSEGKRAGWIMLEEGSIKKPPMHVWRLLRYSEER